MLFRSKSSKTFHDNVNNEKYEENKNIKNKAYLGEEKNIEVKTKNRGDEKSKEENSKKSTEK